MLAMQYSIRLPEGYDADRLRSRVAERRHLFDRLPGLRLKAFLFHERDGFYAPLYVWHHAEAARDFLLGELFQAVVQSFGRPRVRFWTVLGFGFGGRDPGEAPRHGCLELDKVPAGDSPKPLVERELAEQEAALAAEGLHSRLLALDADRWELARFSLWRRREDMPASSADCVQGYEVLHVSEPGRD